MESKSKHGWFSQDAVRFLGSKLYLNEKGEFVEVNCVSEQPVTTFTRNWDDAVYVGTVLKFIKEKEKPKVIF